MKNNIHITLAFGVIILYHIFTQIALASDIHLPEKHIVTYFSDNNGVEDSFVNDIIQDRKGLLWFATWNGLYRFDGYSFENYKSDTSDREGLTNDRLVSIQEDKYGCIWALSYDSTAYRFNPDIEIFEPMPKAPSAHFQFIQVLHNGATWLLCTDGSALRAYTHPSNLSLAITSYSAEKKTLPSGKIHSIFLDSAKQEWVLTDNGLYLLHDDRLSTVIAGGFQTGKQHAFYTAFEKDNQLLFGGDTGKVYVYSLENKLVTVNQLETKASIISILNNGSRMLYITDKDGFFVVDSIDRSLTHFTLKQLVMRKDKSVESVSIVGDGLLWLTHPESGVTLFNLNTQEFSEFTGKDESGRPLNTDTGFFAFEDRNHVLWVHPKGGGFSYYDPLQKELIPFNITDQPTKWNSNDRCFIAFADRQGNLWLSTLLKRLKRITFTPDNFHFYTPFPQKMDLPENEIRALFLDNKGRIWASSRNQDISIYDTQFNLLHRFKAGKVYAIMQDADGIFWLSTKGEGLIKATEVADYRFKFERYTYNADDIYSISSNNIYFIFQDRRKRIWIATYGGGLNLVEQLPDRTLRFINHRNRLKNYPIQRFYKARHVTDDSNGRIWIATTAGILQFDEHFQEPETITFNQICRKQGDENGLSNNDVHMIKCTTKGEIFAVTYGGGLNKLIQTNRGAYRSITFTQKNGLISDIIYAIQEDGEGNLWLVTEGGLVKFIDEGEHIQFPSKRIASDMHFSEGIGITDGQRIFFGTNNGILYFIPEKITKTDFAPPIFFSSIWINNEEVNPRTLSSLLSKSIDNCQEVILPSGNHSLRLIFSALDMTSTEYLYYAYMLEGFDKSYRQTGHEHEANYANLPPGEYLFRVKSTNSERAWVDNERVLSIKVLPTFSKTIYAKLLFLCLILAIGLILIYTYTIFYRMKQKVKQQVKQQTSYNPDNAISNDDKNNGGEPQLSEKDMIFLSKLNELMEAQMNNPDLNVDYIVSFFNLSRTNFFHKLKSLTGLSPIMYVRNARMKRAADLIRKKDYSVAEIAYMVGFSDPHYFSKTFKAYWGMNATEYAKKFSRNPPLTQSSPPKT